MKRIILDAPDTVSFIGITYLYRDPYSLEQMVGMSMITNTDNRNVIEGKEPYILNPKDSGEDDD